jgi:hypothetical protein
MHDNPEMEPAGRTGNEWAAGDRLGVLANTPIRSSSREVFEETGLRVTGFRPEVALYRGPGRSV